MIARIWHGEVAPERADEYLDYLNQTGVPDYRATGGQGRVRAEKGRERPGALPDGVVLGVHAEDRGFRRRHPEKARYYPEDERFLLHFEPAVGHYEVVVGPQRGLLGLIR